jgi:nitrite reductase/ring-hydroxylating ferredoxin subunit
MAENWVKVATTGEVRDGEVVGKNVADKPIAVCNLGGEFYALDNVCTHAFALMSDGWIEGDTIECPLHAGKFEIRTGKGLGDPIDDDLKVYPVRVSGDDVEIDLGA